MIFKNPYPVIIYYLRNTHADSLVKKCGNSSLKMQMLIYGISLRKCIKCSSCSKQHNNNCKYFLICTIYVTLGLMSDKVGTAVNGPNRVHIM